MATANSNRRKRHPARLGGNRPRATKKAVPRRSKARPARTAAAPIEKKSKPRPDLDAILERFSDALAIVETACHALEAAEESENPIAHISPGISTLRHGIKRVQRVYTELDLAILRLH